MKVVKVIAPIAQGCKPCQPKTQLRTFQAQIVDRNKIDTYDRSEDWGEVLKSKPEGKKWSVYFFERLWTKVAYVFSSIYATLSSALTWSQDSTISYIQNYVVKPYKGT